MRAQITNRDYEQLSAYIDGQLAPHEQRRLEERLHANPDLQSVLDDLNRTRALIRQAPRRRAPRNFTLTPAMVGDVKPRRARGMGWNLFPALSFTSALATLVLVASIVFQLLPGQSAALKTAAPQPVAAPQADRAAPEAAQGAAAQGAGANSAASSAPAAPAVESKNGVQDNQAEKPAAGAQASSAPDQASPPVIAWNGTSPYTNAQVPMGRGGGGGGGGGGVPSQGDLLGPPQAGPMMNTGPATGMGGGGSEPMGAAQSLKGDGSQAGPQFGNLYLPPSASGSLSTVAPSAENQSAQPNPQIQGSGPILGIPAPEQAGKVVDQRALLGNIDAARDAFSTQEPAVAAPPAASSPSPARLPILQVLLALIAVFTGVAAYLLRRR